MVIKYKNICRLPLIKVTSFQLYGSTNNDLLSHISLHNNLGTLSDEDLNKLILQLKDCVDDFLIKRDFDALRTECKSSQGGAEKFKPLFKQIFINSNYKKKRDAKRK